MSKERGDVARPHVEEEVEHRESLHQLVGPGLGPPHREESEDQHGLGRGGEGEGRGGEGGMEGTYTVNHCLQTIRFMGECIKDTYYMRIFTIRQGLCKQANIYV